MAEAFEIVQKYYLDDHLAAMIQSFMLIKVTFSSVLKLFSDSRFQSNSQETHEGCSDLPHEVQA